MDILSSVFIKLLNLSISAGWLILAVIVMRFALKKAPKWVNCLWWSIVGIRLALPFSIKSVFSLIPSAEVVSPNIIYSSVPSVSTGIPAVNYVINPVISATFAPDVTSSVNPLQVVTFVLSIIWVGGAAVMFIHAFVSYLRIKSKMKTAVLLHGNIYESENVSSPFILGIIKPRIYLPFNLAEEEKGHIIAHEKAHISRKDHLIKPFAFVLLSVYWFNPLVWVAYVLLCRDIELACDEKVVSSFETEERQSYSLSLLKNSVHGKLIAGCPLAFGEVGVKQRIKSVMNYKRPAFWMVAVALVSCVVAAVCFLTDPPGNNEGQNPGEQLLITELTPEEKSDIAIKKAIAEHSGYSSEKEPSTVAVSYEILGYDDEINEKTSKVTGETYAVFYHCNQYVYDNSQLKESITANRAIISFDIVGENGEYVLRECEFFDKNKLPYAFEKTFHLLAGKDEFDYEEIGYALSEECRTQAAEHFGVASWRFSPMLSAMYHYYCPITFSMEYDSINLQCSDGQLVKNEIKGGQKYARAMTYEGEETVLWTPAREGDGKGEAESAEITFQVIKNGREVYGGIIHATAQGDFNNRLGRTYIFDMYETVELMLRQNSTGAVIRLGEKKNEISFFFEAVDEETCFSLNTDNRVVAKVYLTNKAVKSIGHIIKNAKKIDDRLVDRTRYYFDGKFSLDDGNTYYFSDEHNVIYYDHYIISVTDEEMMFIVTLQGSRSYRSIIDESFCATLTLHYDIPFFEFSPHPLSSKIYYGKYEESDLRIVAKDENGGEEFIFEKSRGRLIFDKENSFPLPEYNKTKGLNDGAIFLQ